MKCDRCDLSNNLYRHDNGWRCSFCIWNERENLIEWAKCLLSVAGYISAPTDDKVVVPRRSLDALAEVVREVTS